MARQLNAEEKARRRERRRLWREENRDEYRAAQRASYQRRKELLALKRADPAVREAKRVYDREHREFNGDMFRVRKHKHHARMEVINDGEANFRAAR